MISWVKHALLATALSVAPVQALVLVEYPFTDGFINTGAPQNEAPGITGSLWTVGAGINNIAFAVGNPDPSLRANNWSTLGPDPDDFWGFTISIVPQGVFELNTLTFNVAADEPISILAAWSVDNFTTALPLTVTGAAPWFDASVDLGGQVATTGDVVFRIFGFEALTPDTFLFIDSVVLQGKDVSAVPEPETYFYFATGAAFIFISRRIRRRRND